MKKFIIPSLLLLSSAAYAETPSLNVHSNDGNVATYSLDEVESVTFEDITKWTVSTIAGNGTKANKEGVGTAASFCSPQGIAFGPDGTLYVCGQNRETASSPFRILAMDKDLNVKILPITGAELNAPWGCTVDNDGYLIVASKANNKVYRINTTTYEATEVTDGGAFVGPMGVKVDSEGSLYIAARDSKYVRKIAKDGTVTNYTVGSKQGPCDMAIDSKGNMYVVNGADYYVYKITPDGTVSTVIGNGVKPTAATYTDGTPGDLSTATHGQSWSIHIDKDGVMYIADLLAFVVREVVPGPDGDYAKGTIRTIAGKPFTQGTANGVGDAANFKTLGTVVAHDGALYVGDNGGNTIRKITAE